MCWNRIHNNVAIISSCKFKILGSLCRLESLSDIHFAIVALLRHKSECIISAHRWSQFGRKQNASEISCREFSLLAYFYHIKGVILNLTWKNSLHRDAKILSYGFFSFFLHKRPKKTYNTRFQYFYSSHTNLNLSKGSLSVIILKLGAAQFINLCVISKTNHKYCC